MATTESSWELGALAFELSDLECAYASYRMIHAKRPKDVKALERLVECAQALSMKEEEGQYRDRLLALKPHIFK